MFWIWMSLGFAQTCADPAIDCDCNSMFALEAATAAGADSCTTPSVLCDANDDGILQPGETCSANQYLNRVYDHPLLGDAYPNQPDAQNISAGLDGNLSAVPLPKCIDGSDDCPGQQLRCVDGTRPLYHVDPADPLHGTVRNDWVFFFQGGGSCGRDLEFTGGEDCWTKYGETERRADMTGWLLDMAGVPIGPPLAKSEGGILEEEAEKWRHYNRVFLHKCSYDRAAGQLSYSDVTAANCPAGKDCSHRLIDPDTGGKPQNADGDAFFLPFTGWFHVQAMFADLRDGRTVVDWETGVETTLPPLGEANRVLFAGHSAGAQHLTYSLDRMNQHLQTWDGFDGDVRGLFDARGWPGVDNEEAIYTGTGDMYDHNTGDVPTCIGCLPSATLPPLGLGERTYSSTPFKQAGSIQTRDEYWGAQPDTSCQFTSLQNPWRCRDAVHVIFNHLSTPFFLRQNQNDQVHLGKPPQYATAQSFLWAPNHYAARIRDQAETFEAERHQFPGRFREPTYGWADPNAVGLGLYMPATDLHSGIVHTGQFTDNGLSNDGGATCKSYSDALYDWMNGQGDQVFVKDGSIDSTPCAP